MAKKARTRNDARRSTWRVDPAALRKARNAKGWTQLDLYSAMKEAGAEVSPRAISQIESGVPVDVRLDTLGSICDALGITLHQACGRK